MTADVVQLDAFPELPPAPPVKPKRQPRKPPADGWSKTKLPQKCHDCLVALHEDPKADPPRLARLIWREQGADARYLCVEHARARGWTDKKPVAS